VEKASWKGCAWQTALFEPFEVLRHSYQEVIERKTKMQGSGRELRFWLPGDTGFEWGLQLGMVSSSAECVILKL